MVSWTDCAGKHQHRRALGWGGLIISLWNIHYSTWNYTELTGLQVRWEVHDPLEQNQSHSGMKPFLFALCLSRALPPTCCSANAFSPLIPVILAWTVVCCACAICSTMGPWHFHEPLGGSVMQIIMLWSSQHILAVLSFRLCHLSHPSLTGHPPAWF